MRNGETGPRPATRRAGSEPTAVAEARRGPGVMPPGEQVIETVVCPFHCLYQDALYFHNQSRRSAERSETDAGRNARAAFVLYLAAAESLVHQAAAELGRPELARLVADPGRPLPQGDVWRMLPAIVGDGPPSGFDPKAPPWPQFAELLTLRASWAYPGPAPQRRAYYHAAPGGAFEPLEPHQVPPGLALSPDRLQFPHTGLPRDPYSLRPRHLDTARSVLDAAIEALDRRLAGALTKDARHRTEPVRVVHPEGMG